MISQIDAHLLERELNKKYNDHRLNEIKKLTSIHKLTYKNLEEKKDSFLCYLNMIYVKE